MTCRGWDPVVLATEGHRSSRGATLLETMFVMAVVVTVGSMGLALTAGWRARTRGVGAARLLLGQVRLARANAVREGVHVGLVFREDAKGELTFQMHMDGNGNGVRRADADRGVDAPLGPPLRLSEWFPGALLGVLSALPPIEGGTGVSAGANPVRLSGGGSILSCGPAGTVTPGTIYVAGSRGEAFAVRALGSTGRIRLFEYQVASADWRERW